VGEPDAPTEEKLSEAGKGTDELKAEGETPRHACAEIAEHCGETEFGQGHGDHTNGAKVGAQVKEDLKPRLAKKLNYRQRT